MHLFSVLPSLDSHSRLTLQHRQTLRHQLPLFVHCCVAVKLSQLLLMHFMHQLNIRFCPPTLYRSMSCHRRCQLLIVALFFYSKNTALTLWLLVFLRNVRQKSKFFSLFCFTRSTLLPREPLKHPPPLTFQNIIFNLWFFFLLLVNYLYTLQQFKLANRFRTSKKKLVLWIFKMRLRVDIIPSRKSQKGTYICQNYFGLPLWKRWCHENIRMRNNERG